MDVGRRSRGVVPAIAGVALVAVLAAASARAQEPSIPEETGLSAVVSASHVRRIEIAVLGGTFGGAELGSTNATELTNQVPTSGQTSLFTTTTAITRAPVVEGRVGVRLTGGLFVEGGLSYAQPDFSVDISADVEGAPNVTATARLTQVIGDVAIQYRWIGRRVSPFVTAGGGYLRQLDEPRTTAEGGAVYFGGGGVLVRLAPASRGWLGRLALRGDLRAVWLHGGITLDDERGPTYQAMAGVTVGL